MAKPSIDKVFSIFKSALVFYNKETRIFQAFIWPIEGRNLRQNS